MASVDDVRGSEQGDPDQQDQQEVVNPPGMLIQASKRAI